MTCGVCLDIPLPLSNLWIKPHYAGCTVVRGGCAAPSLRRDSFLEPTCFCGDAGIPHFVLANAVDNAVSLPKDIYPDGGCLHKATSTTLPDFML